METLSAMVVNDNDKYFLRIADGQEQISIPISEENPADVKSAFNKIILRIKNGMFQIKLDNAGDDLFSLVANEYLTQLNREIKEIYGEMSQYSLLLSETST